MKRLQADFRPASRPGAALWGLAAATLLGAVATWGWAWREGQAVRRLESQLARRDSAAAAPVVELPGAASLRAAPPQGATTLLKTRSFPLPQALLALEKASVVGVVLRDLEVDADGGRVTVSVVANDSAQALAYLARLDAPPQAPERSPLHWALTGMQREGAGGAVVATIVATVPKNAN